MAFRYRAGNSSGNVGGLDWSRVMASHLNKFKAQGAVAGLG
jgi:hypothetical protein